MEGFSVRQRAVALCLVALLMGNRAVSDPERLLTSQPARINAAVASMAPRSGDKTALPNSPTLIAAFEKARTDIAAKERYLKLTPSLPAAYFGAAMADKLEGQDRSPGKPAQ